MKDLKDYMNESLTGAHQIHLYVTKTLEKAIGKEWDQKTIDDIVNNSTIPVMQFDPAKNQAIAKLTKLDTTQPMLIFPDCRTTVREVESFKIDRNIQTLLEETGLDFECVKYYVLLGKPKLASKKDEYTNPLSQRERNRIEQLVGEFPESINRPALALLINKDQELCEYLKTFGLKLGSTTIKGNRARYNEYWLLYKGKIVGKITNTDFFNSLKIYWKGDSVLF